MQVFHSVKEMQHCARHLKLQGKNIALVPTMGALHKGHISLIRKARIDCDVLIVSIYINPTQFAHGEDYMSYPRHLEKDMAKAAGEKVDIVFAPTDKEMYPPGFTTSVDVGELSARLCGAARPGHFQGVCTVVTKLLNIVHPDFAYFGQKDAQQALIIKKIVQDLNMEAQIIVLPIIRDKNGLALSSRNKYLNKYERKAALVLYKSLQAARRLIDTGERKSEYIKEKMQELIQKEKLAKLEYISICRYNDLNELELIEKNTLIALAVQIGRARLIDNYLVENL